MKGAEGRLRMMDAEAAEYELTRDGYILCAAAGLLEELTVFAILGIELMRTPVPVFLVLWAAFGIMSSGLLTFIVSLRDRRAAAVSGKYEAEYYVFPVQKEISSGENAYGISAQRKVS